MRCIFGVRLSIELNQFVSFNSRGKCSSILSSANPLSPSRHLSRRSWWLVRWYFRCLLLALCWHRWRADFWCRTPAILDRRPLRDHRPVPFSLFPPDGKWSSISCECNTRDRRPTEICAVCNSGMGCDVFVSRIAWIHLLRPLLRRFWHLRLAFLYRIHLRSNVDPWAESRTDCSSANEPSHAIAAAKVTALSSNCLCSQLAHTPRDRGSLSVRVPSWREPPHPNWLRRAPYGIGCQANRSIYCRVASWQMPIPRHRPTLSSVRAHSAHTGS